MSKLVEDLKFYDTMGGRREKGVVTCKIKEISFMITAIIVMEIPLIWCCNIRKHCMSYLLGGASVDGHA